MAIVSDFASVAAAQTAGYKLVQLDRGALAGADRLHSILEKPMTGAGSSGDRFAAEGASSASQAAADTAALAALNAQRRHRYGGSPGRASGDGDSPNSRGTTHTIDGT